MTRLFFIGLWTQVDREGRCEDRPVRLKASLFPYDEVDVEGMILELIAYGHIARYTAKGVKVLWVPKFLKHQIPHYKEVPSVLPPPPPDFKVKSTLTQRRVNVKSTSGQPCTQEGKGREGNRKGMDVAPSAQEGVVIVEKPKELTPIQKIIRGFKEAKGVDSDNKDWDRKFFARHTRPANELLVAFNGDPLAAIAYILTKGAEWKHLPDWGLEAVVKAAGREYNRIGGVNGQQHSSVDAIGLDGRGRGGGTTSSGAIVGDALRGIETARLQHEKAGNVAGHREDFSGHDEDFS